MPSELTLFVSDESGQEQQILVQTNPFTIGRQEGNELVLSDAGLSRRHALITVFGDVAQITDCGSQNGTFLNGKQVNGNAVLKNGDVISIGYTCKMRVRLTEAKAASRPVVAATSDTAPAVSTPSPPAIAPPSGTTSSFPFSSQLSPMMIAAIAAGAIVLLTGVLMVAVALRKPRSERTDEVVITTDTTLPTSTVVTLPSAAPETSSTSSPTTSDQFEKSLVQAIRTISNDANYAFSPAIQAEIKRRAAQFATPQLAATLRALAKRGDETDNQIKAQGLKPALLMYLALAETNGGQAGDPLSAARQAIPAMQCLRVHFSGGFADDTLLVVAAYKIPGCGKKSHPLHADLRRLVRDPQSDRNVWYLREKGALGEGTYEFVLRFLAYGAIAQNPRQFNLDAPVLVF